jgi:hypothetical protein
VLVQRLVAKPEHNGKHARVLSFDACTGRYAVALADGREAVSASDVIARLRELRAKATAGPWKPIDASDGKGNFYCHRPRMSVQFHDIEDQYDRLDFANAAAIVAAMNSLEPLLACAEALQSIVRISEATDDLTELSAKDIIEALVNCEQTARAALQALAEGGGE